MQPNFPKLLLCGSSRHSQIKYRTRSRLFLRPGSPIRNLTVCHQGQSGKIRYWRFGDPCLKDTFFSTMASWSSNKRPFIWLERLLLNFRLRFSARDKILNQGLVHQKIFNGKTLKSIKAYFIDKNIQSNIRWSSQ